MEEGIGELGFLTPMLYFSEARMSFGEVAECPLGDANGSAQYNLSGVEVLCITFIS